MNKEELQKLISSEIRGVLIGKAKSSKNNEGFNETQSYLNSEEITEDDFDSVLFFGLGDPKEAKSNKTFTIKEVMGNNLKITTTEIKEFENTFKSLLDSIPGATVVFDNQKNGYSLLAIKKPDGFEAVASGIINLGSDGKISWSYSILNGLTLNAQNLKLTNSNKIISEAIYENFNIWQKTWREKLNYPTIGDDNPQ